MNPANHTTRPITSSRPPRIASRMIGSGVPASDALADAGIEAASVPPAALATGGGVGGAPALGLAAGVGALFALDPPELGAKEPPDPLEDADAVVLVPD